MKNVILTLISKVKFKEILCFQALWGWVQFLLSFQRKVLEELLEVNEKTIFHRIKNSLVFENLNLFEKQLISGFNKDIKTLRPILQTSLKNDDLFLMNGFKTIVSSFFADLITDYFTNNLIFNIRYFSKISRQPQTVSFNIFWEI